jgi:hypothetical protein
VHACQVSADKRGHARVRTVAESNLLCRCAAAGGGDAPSKLLLDPRPAALQQGARGCQGPLQSLWREVAGKASGQKVRGLCQAGA